MTGQTSRGSSRGFITLEEYQRFYRNPSHIEVLSRANLHQIIYMHGFYKLHGGNKRILREAVQTLHLLPPTRSTLEDVTAVGAALSSNQIEEDIAVIGWTDCALDSVRFSPEAPARLPAHREDPFRPRRRRRAPTKWEPQNPSSPPPPYPPPSLLSLLVAFPIPGKRPRSKRKRPCLRAIVSYSRELAPTLLPSPPLRSHDPKPGFPNPLAPPGFHFPEPPPTRELPVLHYEPVFLAAKQSGTPPPPPSPRQPTAPIKAQHQNPAPAPVPHTLIPPDFLSPLYPPLQVIYNETQHPPAQCPSPSPESPHQPWSTTHAAASSSMFPSTGVWEVIEID